MITIIKKQIITVLAFSILIFGGQLTAQNITYKKESFKVWGVCEMCKTLIDKTVSSIDGVKYGRWNVFSKQIKVKYDINRTSVDSIQKALSFVGYDSEKYKASDEAYSNLHKCCKYDRE